MSAVSHTRHAALVVSSLARGTLAARCGNCAKRRKPFAPAGLQPTANHASGALTVRLTQLDGVLPNLALMKLSAWHKARGDVVHFSGSPYRSPTEPAHDRVYGSAVFSFSVQRVARFRAELPVAIVGGTHDPGKRDHCRGHRRA
jgi:hypothetical protein